MTMKSSPAILAVMALLLAALSLAAQAQVPLPGPVLQQVQVPVNRARVPNSGTGPVFVMYILIDPGNADRIVRPGAGAICCAQHKHTSTS